MKSTALLKAPLLKAPFPLLWFACLIAGMATVAMGADREVERGRYLVQVGGCNDCHTPGFAEAAGALPEKVWLTGSPVGFQGPWGTTYPTNLRLSAGAMTEAQWLRHARSAMRPPMPAPSLQAMTDRDLRAVYRFIRHLGPAGTPAPDYVPPGGAVLTPYFDFVPRTPAPEVAR
jgi:mono/diheme cytochrome c family protein